MPTPLQATIVSRSGNELALDIDGASWRLKVPDMPPQGRHLVLVTAHPSVAKSIPSARPQGVPPPLPTMLSADVRITRIDGITLDRPLTGQLSRSDSQPVEVVVRPLATPATAHLADGKPVSVQIELTPPPGSTRTIATPTTPQPQPSRDTAPPSTGQRGQLPPPLAPGNASEPRPLPTDARPTAPVQGLTGTVNPARSPITAVPTAASANAAAGGMMPVATPTVSAAGPGGAPRSTDGLAALPAVPGTGATIADSATARPSPGTMLMAVTGRDLQGRVELRQADIRLKPETPLAGLLVGDQVGVRVLSPPLPATSEVDGGVERLFAQMLIERGTLSPPAKAPSIDTAQLAGRLWRAGSARDETPARSTSIMTGMLEFAELLEPREATTTRATTPAPPTTDTSAQPRPIETLQGPPTRLGESLHWEIERDPDSEQRMPGEHKQCCRLRVDFSALGRVTLTLAAERRKLEATLDCEGVLDHALQTEIADLFGAGTELAARNGHLVMRFARPTSRSA